MLKIMKARPEDLGVIMALPYRVYADAAGRPDEGSMQTLQDIEAEYREGIILKAVDTDGQMVGSIRAHEAGDTLYIRQLMVLPEKQGRGIGTRLLGAIEQSCPKPRYELQVRPDEMAHLAWFEGMGYRCCPGQVPSADGQHGVCLEKTGVTAASAG